MLGGSSPSRPAIPFRPVLARSRQDREGSRGVGRLEPTAGIRQQEPGTQRTHVGVIVHDHVTGHVMRLEPGRDLITPIRVPAEVEIEGLDIPEMGAHGYPDMVGSEGLGHHPVFTPPASTPAR